MDQIWLKCVPIFKPLSKSQYFLRVYTLFYKVLSSEEAKWTFAGLMKEGQSHDKKEGAMTKSLLL